MTHQNVDGLLFADMVRGGAARLRANAQAVDDMNVFPIPDGDTGDNMSMTIEAGISALGTDAPREIGACSAKLAGGMLLGARGNSGVILSQLFAGMADGFKNCEEADVNCLAEAFRSGVRKAYHAVLTPTEGTILTVAREAAEYAANHLSEDSTVESYLEDYRREMQASLKRTPTLLKCLEEAGVLDSGGAGYVFVLEGMDKVLRGETVEAAAVTAPAAKVIDTSSFTADTELEFGYCTEFLLQLQNSKVDVAAFEVSTISDFLQTVGNSVVAFKTPEGVVKVHVHTMTPGRVLDYCQQFGEFLTLKIENMMLQHNESVFSEKMTEKKKTETPKKPVGIVAVATGDGVKETFLQLGADEVIHGGQTMNPSAEDFLGAFSRINADAIIVLPNNGNVILAARQAAGLYDKAAVYVLESKTIGDGYAALSMFDPGAGTIDEIIHDLEDAMRGVVTAMVCPAVRESHLGGVAVKEGDFIGIVGKEILCAAPTAAKAANELLGHIDCADKAVIITLCGKDSTCEEAEEISGIIGENLPELEAYVIDGKQDVYPYIFILQ